MREEALPLVDEEPLVGVLLDWVFLDGVVPGFYHYLIKRILF
jgi:hypothetical protein